jgi:Helix-turn-helix domain
MPEKKRFTRDKVELTDARALRAYAHPTRMTLAGLLRREGPFTATRAAELTGESVASCSYHLRILAKYGLAEEDDPGGPGREKPWRATAEYTDWPNWSDDPAVAEAAQALTLAVAENYFHRLTRAVEARGELPQEWQEAERFTDTTLYLTPEELRGIGERMDAIVAEYADRGFDPSLRPEGARRVPYLQIAYVAPEVDPDAHSREDPRGPQGREEPEEPEAQGRPRDER